MELNGLLRQAFKDLGFSEEFCRECAIMEFGNLEDILVLSPRELLAKEGFSYTWLGELSEFLEQRDLLHLLQTTPGRNHG